MSSAGFTDYIAALHAVTVQLAQAQSFDQLCQQCVELGRRELGFERLGLWFFTRDYGWAVGARGTDEHGNPRDERERRFRLRPDSPGQRLISKDEILLEQMDAVFKDSAGKVIGHGQRLSARLWDGERVIGMLCTDNLLSGKPVTDDQRRLLGLFADAVGVLCSQKQLQDQQRRRVEGKRVIVESANELLALSSVEDVCRRAVELARERLGVERCAILQVVGDTIHNTYGTDMTGETTDERTHRFDVESGEWARRLAQLRAGGQAPITVTEPWFEWDAETQTMRTVGEGEVTLTPILVGRERDLWGVLSHDAAISGAVADPVEQELVSIYCSLVGSVLEKVEASQALQLSEARYRAVVEHSPAGIWQIDPDGYTLYINPAMCALLELDSPADLEGKTYHELFTPESLERMAPEHAKRHEGIASSYEVETVGARGGRRQLVLYGAPVMDEQGEVQSLIGTFLDLTELRALQAQTRRLESELRLALERMPIVLWTTDNELRFTSSLGAGLADLGLVSSQVVGVSLFDYFGVEDPEFPPIAHHRRALQGESSSFEFEWQERDYVTHVQPLQENSNVVGTLGLAVDVTAVKRAERVLRRTLDELEQTQRKAIQQERLLALGQMSSGIAHDFNNALSPVVGFSELLLMSPERLSDVKRVEEYLKMIHSAGQDAANVVRRLREFYRQRQPSDTFVAVDVPHLIVHCVMLTQPRWQNQARADGIDIDVETRIGNVPPVWGVEAELNQALTNLILNAVEALPEGGHIIVSAQPQDGGVLLEVIDDGTGMSEEVRQKCLEPFFTTKFGRGSGLGLAVVYGTVNRHDGRIDVQSEEGGGTRVRIWLPAAKEGAGATEEAPTMPVGPLRILVVDDEPGLRDLFSEYLALDDHQVTTAIHGGDGLEKLREGDFDLVITDRSMPVMNGDQFAKAVKAEYDDMPVIMLTGFGDLMSITNERPDGVDLVVGKPVTIQELQAAIAKVTSGAADAKG